MNTTLDDPVRIRRALYPMPTPERRRIVQLLSEGASILDDEAASRRTADGRHNDIVRDELERASGTLRFVATLVVNGSMSTRKARFWMVATADYLKLVRRMDRRGIIS
jgi:hypothetical protein